MTIKLTSRDIGIDAETPDDCKSLGDVRQAIDTIDKQIIQLLGMRKGYVLSAAQFKETAEAIPAPERVAAMLKARQCWSKEAELSEDFIVPLYAQIIQWFIQQQTHFWHK
ncbi:isochorismate lyase [Vibrio penaeicida]|uniref:chorismate mutase n=1 Tax=Vibrio penaeicida TaxID=104609 RepID=A0AAV5NWR8_9VIBR|nr:isochorismate lyase [Vibrio penaeicida]RTZ19601.1 isochorismate lyase [Vibrio penaeicida]GLQ74492.1 isochorismate-pyruvate lyase [Vibrio penaeicida]